MTHHDRQHIFVLLSCSEIRKFEEGILGGKWYCQNAKCEATQIIFLLKIQSKRTQRAQNLNTSENIY